MRPSGAAEIIQLAYNEEDGDLISQYQSASKVTDILLTAVSTREQRVFETPEGIPTEESSGS